MMGISFYMLGFSLLLTAQNDGVLFLKPGLIGLQSSREYKLCTFVERV